MTAESETGGFIEKFDPGMQERIRSCRAKMHERFPEAVQLVYDNYNFLVIGFGPSRRPSEAIFSLAAQRRGVTLCFLQRGPDVEDPTGLLQGNGKVVRNLPLDAAADLDRREVVALMSSALKLATVPMDSSQGGVVIIQSASAKQRPRR